MANTILGNLWIGYLRGHNDPASIQLAFMQALGTYIKDNAKLLIHFYGVTPSDTVVSFDETISIDGSLTMVYPTTFPTPADGSDGMGEWMTWMNSVYTGISVALVLPSVTVPIGVFKAFPTMITPSWSRDDLTVVHDGNLDDPQGPIMDALANHIIDDMEQNYLPSYPATAMSAVGTATTTRVILPR